MTHRMPVNGSGRPGRSQLSRIAFVVAAIALMAGACNNFVILPNGAYRPKETAFSFASRTGENHPSMFLDTVHLYTSASTFPPVTRKEKKEGDRHRKYCGFFGDGRFITGKVPDTSTGDVLLHEHGIATADNLGYYIAKDSLLQVEFFAHSSDGIGYYYRKEGYITKGSVILWTISDSGEKITDTLFVSGFPLDLGK